MKSTTSLLHSINEQLSAHNHLHSFLPKLTASLSNGSKLRLKSMQPQQILAQVYSLLNKVITLSQPMKEQIVKDIDLGVPNSQQEQNFEGDEIQQEEGQMYGVDQAIEEEQDGEDYRAEYYDKIRNEAGQEGINQDDDFQEERDADIQDEQVYSGEEDIGLYGQELEDQEIQPYENEGVSEEEREFEQQQKKIKKSSKSKKIEQEQQYEDAGQDVIEDNFDHFREIEMENIQEKQDHGEKSQLSRQIEKLQNRIIGKKDWVLQGEIKATQRPLNSLLEYDLQFNSGIKLGQEIKPEYNQDLEKIIKQRILDELFDDRVRYTSIPALKEHFGSLKDVSTEKSKQGLAEIYEAEFKNYLGIGEDKTDKLKTQIMNAFKEINFYLDSLSNSSFTPKPIIDSKNGKKGEVIITEDKTPITLWRGSSETPKQTKGNFFSEKQEDKGAKRLKNKRISRQRKKEQDKKKKNKRIQYGGMTKFQAKAQGKIKSNKIQGPRMKYDKSANFFGQMNRNEAKKPNANLKKSRI